MNQKKMRLYEREVNPDTGKRVRTSLPAPCSLEAARALWFAIGVSVGILFLGIRYALSLRFEIPWT